VEKVSQPLYPEGQYEKAFKNIYEVLEKIVQILSGPIGRLAIDSTGRLRIIIDAGGTATPVSQSGTWTIGAGGVFPVDQRWEMIQRANIEYDAYQRSKFTFA